MRDGNYSHIKNSYLLTYQFPLQLNQHTDGTMVYLLPVGILTMLTTLLLHVQSARVGSVSATRCCQQADAEPLLACRPGWLIQYCIDVFVTKYHTVSCMNIHEYIYEYIYANFERYAGICLTWKNSVSIDSLVPAWTWSVSESGRYRPLAVLGWCRTASGMLSGLVDSILWLIYLLL